MKKLILLVIFTIILAAPHAYASTKAAPTPKDSEVATDSSEMQQIQKIKDIVASKVAELNLVEKKGILGKIKETSSTEVTITDLNGDIQMIDIDELTKFGDSSDDKSSFGVSDLQKGTLYSFVGLYNKDTQHLLARNVQEVKTIPVYFEGAILSIDNENYQITVVNKNGEKKNIDIESSTKTKLLDDAGDLQKSGFSKLETGQRVIVIGFTDKTDSNLISASRIIAFENIPPAQVTLKFLKEDQAAASSSANGK